MYHENILEPSKSFIKETPNLVIPFCDRFYYQQQFQISHLPSNVVPTNQNYSENLKVIIGRKGLHIFDLDYEKWIINENKQ